MKPMSLTFEQTEIAAGCTSAQAEALGWGVVALASRQGLMLGVKDSVEGRYLWVNEGLAALAGCRAADAVGRTDAELFEQPLAHALRCADSSALANDGALASEHRFEVHGERHAVAVHRQRGGQQHHPDELAAHRRPVAEDELQHARQRTGSRAARRHARAALVNGHP